MRTAPMGPSKGTSLMVSAAEAPLIERMAGSFSWSTLSTVETTCTPLRKPLGSSGRSGLSVSRLLEGGWGPACSSCAGLQGPDPGTDLRTVVLPPDPGLRDQSAVALAVVAAQVVEQSTPLPDQEK